MDAVIADADGFNEYVAGNLPYQQRTGKIARKDFNRIEPRFRIESKDRETSIKALEDSVNGRSVPPLETMTIRQYCKYFRIAHEVYESSTEICLSVNTTRLNRLMALMNCMA